MSKTNSVNGKVNIFNDFSTLLEYTQSITTDEPEQVQQKVVTYLSQKQPRIWCKNTIGLTVVLARMETQLMRLTAQSNIYLKNEEMLSDNDLKKLKILTQSTASLTSQINTLTGRLALLSSQLGIQPSKQIAGNSNSREIAELAINTPTSQKPSTRQNTTLDEARRLAKKHLESLTHE